MESRIPYCCRYSWWLYWRLVLLSCLLAISHGFQLWAVGPNVGHNSRWLSQPPAYTTASSRARGLVLHAACAAERDQQSFFSDNQDSDTLEVVIKPVSFHGLRAVSRLLVEEFYGSTMWFPAQYLVELNRLQSNFHEYGDEADRHLMLIATSCEDGSLAGFVDVDGRKRRMGQADLPGRPYLSDLAVSQRHRRKGVGTALVRACEEACVDWGFDRVFLKVHAGNLAAEALYKKRGYHIYADRNIRNEVVLYGNLHVPDAA